MWGTGLRECEYEERERERERERELAGGGEGGGGREAECKSSGLSSVVKTSSMSDDTKTASRPIEVLRTPLLSLSKVFVYLSVNSFHSSKTIWA